MSTNDVPGFNPINLDTLHAGCWAEHRDGSLLFVQGTENNRVVYELFDISDPKNPVEFRDAMPQRQFEKDFSFDPRLNNDVWVWHDKTLFPWDRIMKNFKEGVKPVSLEKMADDTKKAMKVKKKHTRQTAFERNAKRGAKRTAAAKTERISSAEPAISNIPKEKQTVARRIAKQRSLKAAPIKHADIVHRVEREIPKGTIASRVRERIQSAISKLRPGRGG